MRRIKLFHELFPKIVTMQYHQTERAQKHKQQKYLKKHKYKDEL